MDPDPDEPVEPGSVENDTYLAADQRRRELRQKERLIEAKEAYIEELQEQVDLLEALLEMAETDP